MSGVPEDVSETIYDKHLNFNQIKQIRICSISSSSASILLGLAFVYFFGMIHPTRRHFRHYLILLLIVFDFIKATAILVFSCVSFNEISTHNKSLIQGMGWLTVFGIEGADIVILMFAIHMALLIFNSQLSQVKQKLLQKLSRALNIDLDVHFNLLENSSLLGWVRHKWRYLSSVVSGESYSNEKDEDDEDREMSAVVPRRSEGGLYHNRFWVLLITFLFPVLVSSVSFYIHRAYEEYVYWAFFRVWTGPWYFSWTFRHVIVVVIMIIYISIYVYVMSQFKSVSRSLKKRATKSDLDSDSDSDEDGGLDGGRSGRHGGNDSDDEVDSDSDDDDDVFLNTFGDSLWYKFFQFLSMLVFPDVRISAKLHGHGLTTNEDLVNIEKLKNESVMNESVNWSTNNGNGNDVSSSEILGLNSSFANVQNKEISKQIQNLLYEEAMERFAVRKSQIMRQMKVIFIYPISYIILWLLPFINHYQVIRTGTESLWSTAPSAIFQPLNCFVDVLVFLIREKPWQLTKGIDDLTRMTPYTSHASSGAQSCGWRRRVSWLPGYGDYSVELECVDSADAELGKGGFPKRVAYGRNSQVGVLHEDDELDDDYDDYDPKAGNYEEDKSTKRKPSNNNAENAVEGEDDNAEGDDEMDLKDFLSSNSPRRSTQRKKRVSYHPTVGRPVSRPGSLSMTAANPVVMDPNSNVPGRHTSLTSSNRSNANFPSNSRRNSHLSWRTWSLGSNPSNGAGRQRNDKDLDPMSNTFMNESNSFDNKFKIREGSNDVNWNLHMFDHNHRRAYDSNGNRNINNNNRNNNNGGGSNHNYSSSNSSSYRHNSNGSNNNYSSSNNGSYRHNSNGSNNINNHRGNNNNAGIDDEMDLMDFLRLGPRG